VREIVIPDDNLSDEQALAKALQKLSLHIQKSPLAVIDWDNNFCVVAWNPAAEKIFGYSTEQAIGQHASFIIPGELHAQVDGVWKELLSNHGGTRSTNKNVTKEGVVISCEWYNTPITDQSGRVVSVSSLVQDITEQVNYVNALEFQAHHDSLTKLYNRDWLIQFVNDSIINRPDQNFCLFFVDLDRFKEINDSLGHNIGDAMLVILSQRLASAFHYEEYKVVRLGGDEFALLTADCNINSISHQLISALKEPVELAGIKLIVGAGIGIARYPLHGCDAVSLMRCADIAVYSAKENNSEYVEYSKSIDNSSPARLMLMNDLRTAIDTDQLVLYFQPKIDVKNRHCSGYEVLLRWQHPVYGLVLPDNFIPFAEITDLIHPLTMWVIENTLLQCELWAKQGLNYNVSINLSPCNLLDDLLPEKLAVLLDSYDVEASSIELEITENALMKDPQTALTNLNRLNDLGVLISIDDFGTGYSSLSYLRKMPLHKLKIDRTFVFEMDSNDEDKIIVESTINLAHNLGLKVVAEGVESLSVLTLLEEAGCDEAQGFYISRPLPVDSLAGSHLMSRVDICNS